MSLTVFSVIRNGVRNGYPFVEAYGSWLGHCDRIVVLDGGSEDGTQHVLSELSAIDDRLTWASRPWPTDHRAGSSIAAFTDQALELARPTADRLMYVQADEIYTPAQRDLMRSWPDGIVEFAGCVNFWNSLETVVAQEFPLTYIRSFPAAADVTSRDDGFSFEVGDAPVVRVDERILHFGWCFPLNILQKHVSHGALYPDKPEYVRRARIARLLLDRGRHERKLLDALLPAYVPAPYRGEIPACMRHLLGSTVYDPYLALDLLQSGVRW